jgi:cell division protein FtsQ
LIAIVLGTVALSLQRSSYFRVHGVNVAGASTLDQTTVINVSGVLGKQIYEVNPGDADAALQRLPIVQSAQVRRRWPNRVDIAIQERKPWGTWQIGGVNYLIDGDGVVLDIVSAPQPLNVRELDAAPGLRPGDRVNVDAVHTARVLVDQLPNTIAQQVARLEYSTEDGLGLLTDQGVQVRLGDSQSLDYKLAVWQAINAKVGAKNIHLLDLRSVDRPYYR